LDNPNANEVLAVLLLGLAFLRLLLSLFGGTLLLILLDIRSELGNPFALSAPENPTTRRFNVLLLCDDFPLDGLVVIGAAACRAQTVHIGPDVVEAELAYLEKVSEAERGIAQDGTRLAPDIRKDMVGSCGRRDRTPRCTAGCVARPVSGLWLGSRGMSGGSRPGVVHTSSHRHRRRIDPVIVVPWLQVVAGGRCGTEQRGRGKRKVGRTNRLVGSGWMDAGRKSREMGIIIVSPMQVRIA
jgi:hypothetical protein